MQSDSLAQRQDLILHEIQGIRVMKKGTVTYQRNVAGQAGKPVASQRKVYPVLTWKENGGTKSLRLKSDEEVRWAEESIGNYRRFADLCREYEELAEQAALARHGAGEPAMSETGKKSPKSRRKSKPR